MPRGRRSTSGGSNETDTSCALSIYLIVGVASARGAADTVYDVSSAATVGPETTIGTDGDDADFDDLSIDRGAVPVELESLSID